MPTRRRLTRLHLSLLISPLIALGFLTSTAAVASASAPTLTGAPGPCTTMQRRIFDPTGVGFIDTVTQPTGSAATPQMGGHCGDGHRPVAVVIHGLGAESSVLYEGIIQHLASMGNIVVFAPWNTVTHEILPAYAGEVASVEAVVATLPRADTSRIGIVGHSMGGGLLPYASQHLAARGWGKNAFWLVSIAPDWAFGVGAGPLPLPNNAHVLVIAFNDDVWVDNLMGIDQYHAFTVPAAQKHYVLIRSATHDGQTLRAAHTMANTIIYPENTMRQHGIYRNLDATQRCATVGVGCQSDITSMGQWPDGTPVTPALELTQPKDTGPRAIFQCTNPANPRIKDC